MNIPKIIMIVGAGIFVLGLIMYLLPSDVINRIGNLPGDFKYEKENVKVYFPFMTSIILSVVLSILFWIFRKF